ncbi:MAG: hypothetical protein ABJA80_11975, partial [bacterium]
MHPADRATVTVAGTLTSSRGRRQPRTFGTAPRDPTPRIRLDIRNLLERTLGSAYTIERELGGGGMSRVFVAVETALDRKVVIKVLAPELAASVSADRFAREIRL